jgi:hypothetical protein
MKVPDGKAAGLVAGTPASRSVEPASRPPILQAGQQVLFQVLRPGPEGELRVRINGQELTASGVKLPPPGATGQAVVEDVGPPLRIRLAALPKPLPAEPAKMPLLLGKEPLRGNLPPAALEQWNGRLASALSSGAAPSPQFMREAIILSRFIASALVPQTSGKPQPTARRPGGIESRPGEGAPAGAPATGARDAGPAAGVPGRPGAPADAMGGPPQAASAHPAAKGSPPQTTSAQAAGTTPAATTPAKGAVADSASPSAFPRTMPAAEGAQGAPPERLPPAAGQAPGATIGTAEARAAVPGSAALKPSPLPSETPVDRASRAMPSPDAAPAAGGKAPADPAGAEGRTVSRPPPEARPGPGAPASPRLPPESTPMRGPDLARPAVSTPEGNAVPSAVEGALPDPHGPEARAAEPGAGRPAQSPRDAAAAQRDPGPSARPEAQARPQPLPHGGAAAVGPDANASPRPDARAPAGSPRPEPPSPPGSQAQPGPTRGSVPAPAPHVPGQAPAGGKTAATPPEARSGTTFGQKVAEANPESSRVPGAATNVRPHAGARGGSAAPAPGPIRQADASSPLVAEQAAGSSAPPPPAALPEGSAPDQPIARPQGTEAPFWFFVPFPGDRAPLLFPGYRENRRGEAKADWRLFFRLPDIGAIAVRFRPESGGWSIVFEIEHEGMSDLLEAGAPDFSSALRDRGFPLHEVVVRRLRRGSTESEFGAMLSRDTGIALFEERA